MVKILFISAIGECITSSDPSAFLTVPLDEAMSDALIDVSIGFDHEHKCVRHIDARVYCLHIRPDATPHDIMLAYFACGNNLISPGVFHSSEQWGIATAARIGSNIICQAVAGAGKTTVLILCAAAVPLSHHLLLTYNKKLQVEVAERVRHMNNMQIMTYHGAATVSYGAVIFNDTKMREAVKKIPTRTIKFDVLLIDEAQDMSIEYYIFVRQLLALNPNSRMIVVGDEKQSINEYRGANPGFLKYAKEVYQDYSVSSDWETHQLRISQRITPAVASFINRHLYDADIIVGGNARSANRKPRYVSVTPFDPNTTTVEREIKQAVGHFGPANVMILLPSVRNLSRMPFGDVLHNKLPGIPLYIGHDDEVVEDGKILESKVAIMSYASVKGCERQCVILLGFDESYFKYYNQSHGQLMYLPNVLTVAATRAIEALVVVSSYNQTFRTVKAEHLSTDATIVTSTVSYSPFPATVCVPDGESKELVVINFMRHTHPIAVDFILNKAEIRENAPMSDQIIFTRQFKFTYGKYDLWEDVSAMYGILIPILAEIELTGTTRYGQSILERNVNDITTESERAMYPTNFIDSIVASMTAKPQDRSIIEWLKIIIFCDAVTNARHHAARQITNYDWVNVPIITQLQARLVKKIGGIPGTHEKRISCALPNGKMLTGIMDFVQDDGIIWEFKLGGLTESHVLQLVCYILMAGGGHGKLYSMTCDEIYDIHIKPADVDAILHMLVAYVDDGADGVIDLVKQYNESILVVGDGAELVDSVDDYDPDNDQEFTFDDIY